MALTKRQSRTVESLIKSGISVNKIAARIGCNFNCVVAVKRNLGLLGKSYVAIHAERRAEIVRMILAGESNTKIEERIGGHSKTFNKIRKLLGVESRFATARHIDEAKRQLIRGDIASGLPYGQIAAARGVSITTVTRIRDKMKTPEQRDAMYRLLRGEEMNAL